MIKLEINEYCHNCPDFSVKVDKHRTHDEGNIFTIIRCENEHKCREIAKYIYSRIQNKPLNER